MQQISAGAVDPDNGNGSTFALATVFGPLHRVYLDFDETITEGLSATVQVRAVIAGIAKGMSSAEEAAAFVQERKALVGKLTVEYEADHDKQLMSTLAQFPPGEFNMANIDQALDMRAEVDQKWSQIGIENRLFAGVKRDEFLKMAPTTPVKIHALETIQAMQESGAEVMILSINWSADWIQRVIGPNSSVASDNGSSVLEGRVKIYSNEMLYEDEISTGDLSIRMESGRDKAALLRKLLQEGQSSNSQSERRSVFIGDSYNDIQPLLMADVGIVMGQSKAFLLFAEHFGIQLRPLSDALLHPPSAAATDQKTLYITDSWLEVAQALLGKEKADQYLSTISA